VAVTSPPIICRGVVMTGSALGDGQAGPSEGRPPGDIQGFDVRTGKRLWTFHLSRFLEADSSRVNWTGQITY
jgi:quinoprotein glucose dehydrogenase